MQIKFSSGINAISHYITHHGQAINYLDSQAIRCIEAKDDSRQK